MNKNIMSTITPSHLKVNLVSFAYDTDGDASFSWWNHSSENNSTQQAYQIRIGNRAVDLLNDNVLFATEWIESSDNNGVKLPELAGFLQANELYYWQVRIKDNHGKIGDYSQPAKFMVPLTFEQPIHGIWAGDREKQNNELPQLDNVIFLRSPKFNISLKDIDSAIVTAFSRGSEPEFVQGFELSVNGDATALGSGRPQDFYHGGDETAIFYNRYDVTHSLVDGDNVIAVLAGGDSDRRGFYCQLDVYLVDGSHKTVLITDENWKSLDGSSAFGDFGVKIRSIYFGMISENVDMNYYPTGWQNVDFNDSSWADAAINPEPLVNDDEKLEPFESENTYRIATNEPTKKIIKLDNNHLLIDLGKEIIGGLKVDIDSSIEQRVGVLMGEQLQDDGHVRHEMAAGPDYVENWSLKAGRNQFTTFQMKNFRYVELVGFIGSLGKNDVLGWAMQQPFDEEEGNFESDNELLNREYELSKYTIKATNQDVFVDSQARERRPYEGDLLVNGLTSYAVSSHYSLSRHSIDYCIDNPTWPEDYKLFNVEMAWLDYLYTGNSDLLESRYDDLKVKLNRGKGEDSFDGASAEFKGALRNGHGVDNFDEQVGLVTNDGLVDWPIKERDGYVEGTYNTPFNAVTYGAYQTMAKIAMETGHQEDADKYRSRATIIKQKMIELLYDEKTGRFYDSLNADLSINNHTSHHASAYALCYGVYDSDEMANQLSEFVANDGQFIGSVYFIYFMLKGLVDSGNADKAVQLLANDDKTKDAKTFAAILDTLKATIAPEAWSNFYKPNLTLSHPWGATPGLTIVQGIMGIVPLKPGFAEFQVKVRPGNLKRLSVSTPSARGMIRVNYTQTGDEVVLNIDVPMNSLAQVSVPQDGASVTIDGAECHEDQDEIKIGSGRHEVRYEVRELSSIKSK
ncbi:family 78 glycoside hydrolase catalytic domain [Lentilactobacillus sp. Marseille-Q4993]|uniref:family 78 glycoside hydrolase catalytic domain n=1 Tax=Lentilactobacillus sp. Marseille-Q4993 TaxID=3039492 RepID=UPI0024BC371E|nr:family 78 glycoside hydrolase catalytic domain [Lentilactobacillus sp. Marseille-Q4993]